MTMHIFYAFQVIKLPNERVITLFFNNFSHNFYILLKSVKKLITPQFQDPCAVHSTNILTIFYLYSGRDRISLQVINKQKVRQAMVKIHRWGKGGEAPLHGHTC